MWLSERRSFLTLLAGLPIAACGFTPAYAPGGPAAGLLDRVLVDAPTDKNAFDLVERLEERLGRTSAPAYRISYSINTTVEGQGITTTNAVTRFRISGTIDFALIDDSTDAALSRGTVSSFTSYSASGTPVSTVSSEADANTRLMRLLADQIVTRLIATSGQWSRG
jgi:LPS-assembly lipoprotein